MAQIKLNDLVGNDSNQETEQQKSINDELRIKVISNLLDMENNSKVNSRINKMQVNAITKLFMFSKVFNNQFTSDLATEILNLQVSIQGLGRKELVQILQSSSILDPNLDQSKTIKEVFR